MYKNLQKMENLAKAPEINAEVFIATVTQILKHFFLLSLVVAIFIILVNDYNLGKLQR